MATERRQASGDKPLNAVTALLGECFCEFPNVRESSSQSIQILELHGVEFISLGAVLSESTPQERVQFTIEQISQQTKRLISIGYLVEDKVTKTIPLETFQKSYPHDKNLLSRQTQKIIDEIKKKDYSMAIRDLNKTYQTQKALIFRGKNKFLAGITAHNLGVLYVLSGQEERSLPLFRQATTLKRTAFGTDHPEVATSLDEIGIQLFAKREFDEALFVLQESHKIRSKHLGNSDPKIAMVLNNIGCCRHSQGNHHRALITMKEARELQKKTAKGDLDLLHVAITLSNLGYLQIQMKQYEQAQSVLEEALLIQQSVFGDENNKAIQDTRSNMEFTNAFHS